MCIKTYDSRPKLQKFMELPPPRKTVIKVDPGFKAGLLAFAALLALMVVRMAPSAAVLPEVETVAEILATTSLLQKSSVKTKTTQAPPPSLQKTTQKSSVKTKTTQAHSPLQKTTQACDTYTTFNAPNGSIYVLGCGTPINAWNDIPLEAGPGLLHYVNEMKPRQAAKTELHIYEPYSPIRISLSAKAESLMVWNYGSFPQTIVSHVRRDPRTGIIGDGDPLDCVELGSLPRSIGEVVRVKVLGSLALIDIKDTTQPLGQEVRETDWKVLTISADDPLFDALNDVYDIDKYRPGTVNNLITYFRTQKVVGGGFPGELGFDGMALNRSFTLGVVQQAHQEWIDLGPAATSSFPHI